MTSTGGAGDYLVFLRGGQPDCVPPDDLDIVIERHGIDPDLVYRRHGGLFGWFGATLTGAQLAALHVDKDVGDHSTSTSPRNRQVARKAHCAAPAELQDVPAPGDPQLASDVRDVLRRLAPHHRAILVLRDLEGLDEQAVSGMLAVSVGTAKSRPHRARRRFRQEWDR
jgi:Sigma-70, region 4